MPLRSVLSKDNQQLRIIVEEPLDSGVIDEFRGAYIDYIYQDMKYVVDLGKLYHIESQGLGMLISMRKLLGEHADIDIINCCPKVKRILEYFRLDQKFRIHTSAII